MFIDRATIYVKSGDGGHGLISFRHEKYIAAGGPDGGDGGNGGNIIFEVDPGATTLADFRYKRKYVAPNGDRGGANKSTGKSGSSLIIKVPQGTLIKEKNSGRILADMVDINERKVISKGGKGGKGNMHFATATRQVPNFARAGLPGQDFDLILELKLLADVGLVGFPNVGKSTLLSVTTGAKPEIADYHFTTLTPNLGVVYDIEGRGFVMADIPGLIEGASEGIGLGHEFLRHIERTRLIVHVIDMAGSEGRDPFDDFLKINKELELYNPLLAQRPQLIAANKMDMDNADENLVIFKKKMSDWLIENGHEEDEFGAWKIFEICAAIAHGTRELMAYTGSILSKIPVTPLVLPENEIVVDYNAEDEVMFEVNVEEDGVYNVTGKWIKNISESINLQDNESLQYFQRLIKKIGLVNELENLGINDGDTVRIYDMELEFYR